MRDAFGGAFMIKLFLVFLIVYVSFIAIALNYAKAFKVKDAVINYLETNEITSISDMSAVEFTEMTDYFYGEILGSMNYYKAIPCPNSINDEGKSVQLAYCRDGIVIYQYNPIEARKSKDGVYYKVITYFGWNIPFINGLLKLNGEDADTPAGTWEISGVTRAIVGS